MKRWVKISWVSAVFAFLYAPLLVLMVYSFNRAKYTTSWQGFSLEWYARLLDNPQLVDAFVNSLTVALVSSLAATALGTLGRLRFPGTGLPAENCFWALCIP